jgi:hypothetical protein
MAIILRTPSTHLNKRFEFEVSNDNKIQIRKIVEPQNPEEAYTLNPPFFYDINAIRDLYLWLLSRQKIDGWVELGTKNETETPNAGTVEEWARSTTNPIGGFYGLTPHLKGRFATFIPPILEYMGLAEVEHKFVGNRMRARLRTGLGTTQHTYKKTIKLEIPQKKKAIA